MRTNSDGATGDACNHNNNNNNKKVSICLANHDAPRLPILCNKLQENRDVDAKQQPLNAIPRISLRGGPYQSKDMSGDNAHLLIIKPPRSNPF